MLGDHPSSPWALSKHFVPRGCRMKDAQSMFVKSMRWHLRWLLNNEEESAKRTEKRASERHRTTSLSTSDSNFSKACWNRDHSLGGGGWAGDFPGAPFLREALAKRERGSSRWNRVMLAILKGLTFTRQIGMSGVNEQGTWTSIQMNMSQMRFPPIPPGLAP